MSKRNLYDSDPSNEELRQELIRHVMQNKEIFCKIARSQSATTANPLTDEMQHAILHAIHVASILLELKFCLILFLLSAQSDLRFVAR